MVAKAEMKSPRVLVLPRLLFDLYPAFVKWSEIEDSMEALMAEAKWLPRSVAERSTKWVQPIPCVYLKDPHETSFCILRAGRGHRRDLDLKLSLLFGGHVEAPETGHSMSLSDLLLSTLNREVEEEIGLEGATHVVARGLIVDHASIQTSRHVAFVYSMVAWSPIRPKAPEEFLKRSKFNGVFESLESMSAHRSMFDPWSRILLEDWLFSATDQLKPRVGRQLPLRGLG